MKDLELARRFPQPLFMPTPKRCPSCFALPKLLWRSVIVVRNRPEYIDTCSAHYCRSRAHEFAGVA